MSAELEEIGATLDRSLGDATHGGKKKKKHKEISRRRAKQLQVFMCVYIHIICMHVYTFGREKGGCSGRKEWYISNEDERYKHQEKTKRTLPA